MMNTRRSLLTFGALLAAFVILAPGSVFAQDGEIDDASVAVAAGTATGSIVVTWTAATAAPAALDMFEIQYRQFRESNTANQNWMGDIEVGSTTMRTVVTGLNHNNMYEARVRVVYAADGNNSAWVSSASHATDAMQKVNPTPPTKPVRVASPSVTVGDEMLSVEWLEPASELEINLYRVYYMAKGGASKTKLVLAPETSVTLTSLENDVEYTIEVSAESDAGEGPKSRKVMATPKEGAGGPMTPTPTPALPLFGAFALGAGVLAAGRARLRRREQRRLTR